MEVQQGIAVLLRSNLEGKIERFTVNPAQLNASDDPDLYLGLVLKPTIRVTNRSIGARAAVPHDRDHRFISGLHGSESDTLA